jgi:hypothetical protein
VRVAILKYLRSSSRYKGPRGAVEGLVVNQLSPHVKKEVHAILDANRWRTDRMYLLEVRHPPSTQAGGEPTQSAREDGGARHPGRQPLAHRPHVPARGAPPALNPG